ncbi:4Fe-4S dicluster domain-containing protein [Aceticella autotrophica]|uniref:4Fe-4S dicluster domain-containing protein n=1 Tax=Aceticella autotrophica TaxID=2755338 RepID=A0A975G9R3_9THEO|nr:4Fe-4S dicluster domain-containing protein [Aceticella autotrophica]QSZ26873.1 4Fe-4S dicluster domain-containing protein [Aceticella autotrophica]
MKNNLNAFVIANPNRCIGCRTCEIACALAHLEGNPLSEGTDDFQFNQRLNVIKTATVSSPIQCRHCEDAPCANVCPVGAIVRKNNTIQINNQICIGCKNCLLACPFGAIDFITEYVNGKKNIQENLKIVENSNMYNKERIIANKCDLCIGRENGPACVEVCPTNALRLVKPNMLVNSIKEKRKKVTTALPFI